MHVCLVLGTSLVTLPVTILFACVFCGVGVPTLVSGVLQQLQIADRPEVRGVESATCNYMLRSTLSYYVQHICPQCPQTALSDLVTPSVSQSLAYTWIHILQ